MATKDPLVLLGIWNVLPVEVPGWFDVGALEHFRELTGVTMRSFLYIENELNYECFFEREMNELRERFERAGTEEEQIQYINGIYDDFNKEVPELETCISAIETEDFRIYSNEQLASAIERLVESWMRITMQVWYALFLDIWYPLEHEHTAIKQIAATARDHAGHLHERSNRIEQRAYAEAAKRLSLAAHMISYLFPAEIADGLRNGTSYTDEIARRSAQCVILGINGKLEVYSGDEALTLLDRYQPPHAGNEAAKELSGVPASRGSLTGVVRVIVRNKDFDKFQEGEVLVALNTMVHYLPIMKKASAILTEFGGLTSHAAIVSRELGKPCIVGIPNLLASLKDGDTVEIDASRGTVRVIRPKIEHKDN
jgi:phosphohistidine swiveling domain-containing protein